MNPRHLASLLIAVAAAVGLVLTLPGASWAQKRGGTLTYMVPASDPPSLDGHRETTFATVHPMAPIYSLLIHVDPRSKGGKDIVGDLATSWKVSADSKTYTFALHKGVTFHDGAPLTAKDVVASLNKIIFPPEGVLSPRKAYFTMVDTIRAANDHTVEIKLKFASPAFIPALAAPYNFIYKAETLAKDPHWYEKNALGSGPFKLVSYVAGDKVVGVRNEKYYIKGQPYLDGFEAIFAPKETVQMQALRGERAHANFRGLPPAARDDLVRAMGAAVTEQVSDWNCGLFAVPNSTKAPFSDKRVRQALSLALDRHQGAEYLSKIAIVKSVGGLVFPGHELAPSPQQLESLPGYGRDVAANRARARALLREAGVPDGYSFTFTNRNTDQPYRFVGTWLIDQWRQIGLNVVQEVLPTPALYAKLRAEPKQFDVSIDFNCQSIVNPTLDISKFLSSDKSDSNDGGYTDRTFDELFEKQLRESDKAKQRAILWEMEQQMADQNWYITTLWWNRIVVHSAKMKWWEVTPSHYLNMNLASVWLDQ